MSIRRVFFAALPILLMSAPAVAQQYSNNVEMGINMPSAQNYAANETAANQMAANYATPSYSAPTNTTPAKTAQPRYVYGVVQPEAPMAGEPPRRATEKNWRFTFGPGFMVKPKYEGSGDYKVSFTPFADIRYRDLLFINYKDGLGVNAIRWEGFQIGPVMKINGGRDEDDSKKLRGMGDVDMAVELGGFVKYKIDDFGLKYEALQDVADGHNGFTMNMGGSYSPKIDDYMSMSVGTSVTWASKKYMQSMFGVNAAQSARSGYAVYTPKSGFKDIGFNTSLTYKLPEGFAITGIASYKLLFDEAGDSPIVKNIGSTSQFVTGLFVTYSFGL
jgi:MipA family protein